MKILIVDDEAVQREMLAGFLTKKGYEVSTAKDGETALDLFGRIPFSLVITDHKMPGMTGDELLERIRALNPNVNTIMVTAYGDVDTAVSVMKLGARDFLEKPVDLLALLEKIQAMEQQLLIQEEADVLRKTLDIRNLPLRIIGDSPAMVEVLSLVGRMAPTDWTAMVRGETGTGKELIARLLHLLSPRRPHSFVEVNCAAIPENLFESELFGHEKGAFTGALTARRGKFELAHRGTLFLDEVGELPLNLQAKLLKALQEKKITRVGSETEKTVDVRVVAATNRDLKQMVQRDLFREDLYFRLNVLDMELPPLRNRREDIPDLAAHFLGKFSPVPMAFHAEALHCLSRYAFPGNVRELEHIIQRTVTFCRSTLIREQDLPHEVRFQSAVEKGTLAQKLEALEKELILTALSRHRGVQTRAASELGISERVLRYKLNKYGLKS